MVHRRTQPGTHTSPMALAQRQLTAQRLQQRADPQLLLTNRLLQMSALELRQCIAQELCENPALEAADGEGETAPSDGQDPREPTSGCPECARHGQLCSTCASGMRVVAADFWRPVQDVPDEEYDPLALVEAPRGLRDHLLLQVRASLSGGDERIGAYLVALLEPDGYLRTPLHEAAAALEVPIAEAERVLRHIQTLDPPGVGARDLRECLLVQARGLAQEGRGPHLALRMLSECWKEFCAGRWKPIARRLRLEPRAVAELAEWVRGNLSPYPGHAYRGEVERRAPGIVQPDVLVIRTDDGGLSVTLTADDTPAICLSPQYTRLWEEMRANPSAFTEAERSHLREFLHRAHMFVRSLQDRKSMLRRVAECLAEEQRAYLLSEREEDLVPLTQAQIASFLQVHESTVSRAVAEKYLQLPGGRVVPLSQFFDRAASFRRLVANVVASEDPAAPYSDQQISEILRRQGVVVARRTVMKYREEMNILSSRQRGGQAR